MELNIQEEMDAVTDLRDPLAIQLNEIFGKMWQCPGKEYLLVYHPESIYLFKIQTFSNLLSVLGLSISTQEGYLDPAIVFSCIGSYMGAISYDRKYPVEFKPHGALIIDKITMNKYQSWYIKNKNIAIKLGVPTELGEKSSQISSFQEITIKRHPQLRRILKEYFMLIDQKFDEALLKSKLDSLGIKGIEYSYLDYDELFLLNKEWFEGTYFEEVPIELKKIIIGIIDEDRYLSREKIFMKDEPIIRTIENILDVITESDNASMMDIYEKALSLGYLDEFIQQMQTDQSANGNIYKYITSSVGLNNIKDIVNGKINQK